MRHADVEELVQVLTEETVRGERLAHGLLLVLLLAGSLLVIW